MLARKRLASAMNNLNNAIVQHNSLSLTHIMSRVGVQDPCSQKLSCVQPLVYKEIQLSTTQ